MARGYVHPGVALRKTRTRSVVTLGQLQARTAADHAVARPLEPIEGFLLPRDIEGDVDLPAAVAVVHEHWVEHS